MVVDPPRAAAPTADKKDGSPSPSPPPVYAPSPPQPEPVPDKLVLPEVKVYLHLMATSHLLDLKLTDEVWSTECARNKLYSRNCFEGCTDLSSWASCADHPQCAVAADAAACEQPAHPGHPVVARVHAVEPRLRARGPVRQHPRVSHPQRES